MKTEQQIKCESKARRKLLILSIVCLMLAIVSLIMSYFICNALFNVICMLFVFSSANFGIASLKPGSKLDKLRACIAGEQPQNKS